MRAGDHRLGLSVLARVGPGVEGEARSFEVGVGPAKEGGGQTPPEARDWGSRGGKGVAAEAGEWAGRTSVSPPGARVEAGVRSAGTPPGSGWPPPRRACGGSGLGIGGRAGSRGRRAPRCPRGDCRRGDGPRRPGSAAAQRVSARSSAQPEAPRRPAAPAERSWRAGGVRCGHVCCRRGRGSPLSQGLCAAPYSRVPGSRREVPPGLGTRESGGTRPAVSPPSAALSPVAAGRDLETPPPRPPPPGSPSRPEGVALSRRCPRLRSLLAEPVPPAGPGSPVPAPVACANVPDITMGWGHDKERRRNTRRAEPALPAPPTGRRPEGSLNASRAARPHPQLPDPRRQGPFSSCINWKADVSLPQKTWLEAVLR
ncbi:basic salivary proline-rich protein 3-like [Prionailurus viverrinus]|uniref:basic salivary proline-rich protein 3-like n=1 Tax=Prionailurus viverrinus TaxID=61388 RepID=UPI001FF64E6A|nr:basic salivary proline-rich protein 3-like [Prionailurus viverrinus]